MVADDAHELEPGCPDEVGIDAIKTLLLDQALPAEFLTGQGVDVRPHPHIGLGTFTYLIRRDLHHRDTERLQVDDAALQGDGDGMGSIPRLELGQHTSHVSLNGLLRNA